MNKKFSFYLVVSKNGHVAARKTRPPRQPGQLPIRVMLSVPTALFGSITPDIEIVVSEKFVMREITEDTVAFVEEITLDVPDEQE